MVKRVPPKFIVNSETTAKVNEDWESLKQIIIDMHGLMILLKDIKIPRLKNKIYNLFWEIDGLSTFYMSPFSNFITAYGYYFNINDVRNRNQRESKLIVSKELVPIPENWHYDETSRVNEWVYPDSGHWDDHPNDINRTVHKTVNVETPEEFQQGIRIKDNRNCSFEWTEENKINVINVMQRYINFCNIDYLQYAMDNTLGWDNERRKERIKKANKIIQLISC